MVVETAVNKAAFEAWYAGFVGIKDAEKRNPELEVFMLVAFMAGMKQAQ